MKRRFAALHDYHTEGWQFVGDGECDTIGEAVQRREKDLANGGGECIIVEVLDTLEAYRSAAYEAEQQRIAEERKRQEALARARPQP